jgi:hypothetical protein
MELKNNSINNYDFIKSQSSNTETPFEDSNLNSNCLNDHTFNKLRDLQSLIKKESALKELCKKKTYINK